MDGCDGLDRLNGWKCLLTTTSARFNLVSEGSGW